VNERPKHGKQLNVGSDLRLDLGLDVKDLRLDLRLDLKNLRLDLRLARNDFRLDLRLAHKDFRLAGDLTLETCVHLCHRVSLYFTTGRPFTPVKIAPSHGGIWTLSNTWFPVATRVLNPNGISIGSAVFAGQGLLV